MYFCYLNKQNIALIRNRDKSVWVSQGQQGCIFFYKILIFPTGNFFLCFIMSRGWGAHISQVFRNSQITQNLVKNFRRLLWNITKSFQEFINRENSLVSFLVIQYRRSDLTLPSSDTIYNEWHLPWYKWSPPWAPSRTGGTRSSRRPTPGPSGAWGACCAWRVHSILLSLNGLVHQCMHHPSL